MRSVARLTPTTEENVTAAVRESNCTELFISTADGLDSNATMMVTNVHVYCLQPVI